MIKYNEFISYSSFATSYHRLLNDKYESLQKLREAMIQDDFTKRPSCESILKNTSKWRLNIEKIMEEQYFTTLKSDPPESIEVNLSRFIICKKLEQFQKKNDGLASTELNSPK